MFSPEMMAQAQKMMANMKPEDMQRMTQMAQNMDPKVMEGMMKNMGGELPAGMDTQKAMKQMSEMSPEELRAGMSQAQQQMSAQKTYYCNAAEMLKNEGNELIKSEKFDEALSKYTRAVENLKVHSGKDVDVLRVGLLNNSALCHLKMKAFDKVVEATEGALKIDRSSFKAYYRRGQAREQLGQLSEAVQDVRKAASIAPKDKAINGELTRLRGLLTERGLPEPPEPAAEPEPAVSSQASPLKPGAPDVEKMQALFENPDMMNQALDMTSKLSDEDLRKMSNNGEDADQLRKIAADMKSDPNLMKQMSEMMKNMKPEQLQSMMEMSAQRRGGAGDAAGSDAMAGGPPDPSAMLNDPAMMKATEEMMKNLSPEMLSSMAKANGLDLSEDKAKLATKFLPWLLRLMRWFGHLKKTWSMVWSPKGRIALAAFVVLIAVWQHNRSS